MVSRNEREGRYTGHALGHAVRMAGQPAPHAQRAYIARVAKVLERYERATDKLLARRVQAYAMARITEIDGLRGDGPIYEEVSRRADPAAHAAALAEIELALTEQDGTK